MLQLKILMTHKCDVDCFLSVAGSAAKRCFWVFAIFIIVHTRWHFGFDAQTFISKYKVLFRFMPAA